MESGVLAVFLFLNLAARVGASDSLLSPKGVNYEVAALMSLKNKMVDKYHVLEGWDINSVDPCTWNMVGCSQEGYVISLEMLSVGLSGPLSPSIGNLTHLRTMLLQNNQLFGYIPYEIGKLRELQSLDLSGNQFGGEIPSSLGDLTHLSYLRLSRNKLSGVIPKPVADLSGLSILDLSYNDLSGPTPKILAKRFSVAGNVFLCSSVSAEICRDSPKSVNETSPYKSISKHHHRWLLPVILGVSCTFVVSVMLLACWVHWYRSRLLHTSHVQQDYEFDISHLKRFTFRELQNATNNFSPKNVLGRGGFGVVYKGYLPNNVMVAVKRLLDPNFTGEVQFQTEVEMIGLALHRNLLRLYGFCMTPEERLLVYPYMPNGSVADRLRDNGQEPSLDWRKRMRVALGAARGLLYLHEQCNPKIIHRDVKAANILLDESFEAVVGDFGLAKLLDRRDSHVTTAVRGTIGHIAPEYLSTGQSSEKTDVFGYGILLLELITGGQKALNMSTGLLQKGMILDWVKTLQQEKRLEVLVDRDLKGCFRPEELAKVVEIALQCTQSNPMQRPKMSDVLPIVEAIAEGQPFQFVESHVVVAGNVCPDRRAFSFSRNLNDGYEESSFIIEAIELSGPR